jgi:hypothetical protein
VRTAIAAAIALAALSAPAMAGELDNMIKSSDVSVMRDYLQAQADAGKIEPTFDIDDSGDGNVDVNFMGPYIHDHWSPPSRSIFGARCV